MFAKLFAEGGLSLDRLRALLAVGAAGSIVKAAEGDAAKQSQFSRQIKELEDFFQVKLVERHGKGIRLTSNGKELARISRFFLLGLSNFRRGCLAEEQIFRMGASATFLQQFLLPTLAGQSRNSGVARYGVEIASDDEVERRLQDLTLDFGIVMGATISRPLQLRMLGTWRLSLWTSRRLATDAGGALRKLKAGQLPLVIAAEMPRLGILDACEPRVECGSFLEAKTALETGALAAFLPDFLRPADPAGFIEVNVPTVTSKRFPYRLAWNPRLLRLNPHAVRTRDLLFDSLRKQLART